MTREKFIKKWLGDKDYQYTEQNRDLMRDDLDEVINQALSQPLVIKSVCDKCNGLRAVPNFGTFIPCDACNQ